MQAKTEFLEGTTIDEDTYKGFWDPWSSLVQGDDESYCWPILSKKFDQTLVLWFGASQVPKCSQLSNLGQYDSSSPFIY